MWFGEPTLEAVQELHEQLRVRGEQLALAESCTGGLLGAAITAVGGSSDVFDLGMVTYSNAAKIELLGVPSQTIDHTGAVSGPTARAMAVGVRDQLDEIDWAISITGLAGPAGGRPGKPVGTVYIGVATSVNSGEQSFARRYRFDGNRDSIRIQTVKAAIDLAIDTIDQSPKPS